MLAPLPAGIRSRFVDGVKDLRMHVLEAGFEPLVDRHLDEAPRGPLPRGPLPFIQPEGGEARHAAARAPALKIRRASVARCTSEAPS